MSEQQQVPNNEVLLKESVEVLTLKMNWEPIKFTEEEFLQKFYEKWQNEGRPNPRDFVTKHGWFYPIRIRKSNSWTFSNPVEFATP